VHLWEYWATLTLQIPNIPKYKRIVTDLLKALLGIGSLNTVQHAAIDEAVFSMLSMPSRVLVTYQ
jgi:hypothetical protein